MTESTSTEPQNLNDKNQGICLSSAATSGGKERSIVWFSGITFPRVRKSQIIRRANKKSIMARVKKGMPGTSPADSASVNPSAHKGPAMMAIRLPRALARG